MNATVKRLLTAWIQIAAAAFMMSAAALDVRAAGLIPVLEQRVTEDTAYLYLRYSGAGQTAEAQIGTDAANDVTIIDGEAVPVVTWLVMDTSKSYSDEDRNKAKELFTSLVAGRSANETFTLCTYTEQLEILLQDSRSYADLKREIDAIEHYEHVGYLTDAIWEILDIDSRRDDMAYTRIIVVSDSGDQNPGGLTRDELNRRLDANNIPIYTLGCETGGNEQQLKELYSLSRQTGAQSWSLTGLTDTLEVVRTMSGEELPICAAISIPEELRDGGVKGVKLTFSDGSTAETQLSMPFGSIAGVPAPSPSSEPDPTPTQAPASESADLNGMLLIFGIAAGVLLLVVAVVIVVVILLVKKKKSARTGSAPVPVHQGTGRTDVLNTPNVHHEGEGTLPLVSGNDSLMLCLIDCVNPDRHFEVPLRGRVTIGRNNTNRIVLDYERSVSGTHCEIFVENGMFKIRDLNSSNGTYVDGVRVTDVAELLNGSRIKLGRLEFMVGIK